jgi:hypothetical protein
MVAFVVISVRLPQRAPIFAPCFLCAAVYDIASRYLRHGPPPSLAARAAMRLNGPVVLWVAVMAVAVAIFLAR